MDNSVLIYFVFVNIYFVIFCLLQFMIVVVDIILQELQCFDLVWNWFSYVLLVNLLLVVFLFWFVVYWSLRFIKVLVSQISQLEKGECDQLDENLF